MADKISPFLLERFVLGECSQYEKARVEGAMAADPALARKVETMREEDAAFRKAHPPRVMVPEIQARAKTPRNAKWWFYLTPAIPLALVALVVSTWWTRPVKVDPLHNGNEVSSITTPVLVTPPEVSGLRTKGGDALTLHFKGATGAPVILTNGQSLPGKGALQIVFRTETAGHALVFSVDRKGHLTWHHPGERPKAAPEVKPQTPRTVGEAYELDPGEPWEMFVLLTFAKPKQGPALDELLKGFEKPSTEPGMTQTLPAGVQATRFLVRQTP